MKTILVIGGGFSGVVVAAQLLQKCNNMQICIILANGSCQVARGMAYSTQSADHRLNVPAGNMSALDDVPDHFLRFAQARDSLTHAGSFVPRNIYGDYLEWLLEEAELQASNNATLLRIYKHVVHLRQLYSKIIVTMECGKTMEVDKVVLALGHFPSSNPPMADIAFYESSRYLRDPWDEQKMAEIEANEPVLLLGTGLTAIDTMLTLLKRNPQRRIMALSRRGLLPQPHRHGGTPPSAHLNQHTIWGDASTLRDQVSAFRYFCRALVAEGRDWREAMAILRPVTADVWLAYSEREKKRFLRHIQPYWDTHRHRLAPTVHECFALAHRSGTVQTLAAGLMSFEESAKGVTATFQPRGTTSLKEITVSKVINCTGPCADPRHTGNALVEQLLSDGLIKTDQLGLGLEIGEDCAVIDAEGNTSQSLYYIGPWLKANYWEATAVPDLRRFAAALARKLLLTV